jgi:hypothetical protein
MDQGQGTVAVVGNDGGSSREVFALTDEQIVGLGTGDGGASSAGPGDAEIEEGSLTTSAKGAPSVRDDGSVNNGAHRGAEGKGLTPEGVSYRDGTQEVPEWLAERMRDGRDGEAARELWDGKQRAEKEAAAYREVFATPGDARALKEIYPGGMTEAKAAAERARELDAIDAVFYRGDARARMQLAQKMMREDPGAFREMVAAGLRLLKTVASDVGDPRPAIGGEEARGQVRLAVDGKGADNRVGQSQDARIEERSLAGARDDGFSLSGEAGKGLTPEGVSYREGNGAQTVNKNGSERAEMAVAPEVVRAYGEFEKAANLELEKSVGGAISRVMEQALPNLRVSGASGREGAHPDGTNGTAPLRDRLTTAVREEVDTALRNDRELGEQVARVLGGRRFDAEARAQVVRLIDARAQQLVPGAVRRVVGSWTSATLEARGKARSAGEVESRAASDSGRKESEKPAGRSEKAAATRRDAGPSRGRRVDYGKMSDEEILRM